MKGTTIYSLAVILFAWLAGFSFDRGQFGGCLFLSFLALLNLVAFNYSLHREDR